VNSRGVKKETLTDIQLLQSPSTIDSYLSSPVDAATAALKYKEFNGI